MKRTILLFSILLLSLSSLAGAGELFLWWQLPATQTTITFNVEVAAAGDLNYWWWDQNTSTGGNGSITASTNGPVTITGIPAGGTVQMGLGPNNLRRFHISNGPDKLLLTEVEYWGNAQWSSMEGMFNGCSNLVITAPGVPNLSGVSRTNQMFMNCTSLTTIPNADSWDVSNVTDMNTMFSGASSFNQDISTWDVSNVQYFGSMFQGAAQFNSPLNDWDMSSALNTAGMFANATSFNQPLNNWNTTSITNMGSMFGNAVSFNQNLNSWDVSGVVSFSFMFEGANSFNQSLDSWNTSSVQSMDAMFRNATNFNQPIGTWNTSNVSTMNSMFYGASAFNQDINLWDVSNVTNMSFMFHEATSFNQSLSSWNTSSVIGMFKLFFGATSFNQDIGIWDYSSCIVMENMFDYSGIDCETYGDMLSSWGSNATLPMSLTIGVLGLYYTDGDVATRNFIISENGITFSGDIYAGATCATASVYDPSLASIVLFPNPATNKLTVTKEGTTSAQITSSNGAILAELELNGETTIDVSSYAPGVYFIRTAEGQTVKFIKE
jgi:surface protein